MAATNTGNPHDPHAAMDRDGGSPYHPLDQSKRQFRLLRLLESTSDCINCEIRIFSLADNDQPPWKALSYRWGDDEPEFVVHVNDQAIPIRKNLHKIITQMIMEERRDWIFIDALCINQDDKWEKPGQVQLMGEVYRQADEVVAWIVFEPSNEDEEMTDGPVYDPYRSPSVWRAQLESSVLENSYWSRLWIVQEVLLAKRLTIRMGAAEVEWSNLVPEQRIFQNKGLPKKNDNLGIRETGDDPYANKTTALNILSYRRFETKSLRAGHHIPFHQALDFFSTQRCGRLHDRVFGYLGLTNSRIQVDYSMSIIDLFVATLADYLLSVGFITQDFTPYRRRLELMRTHHTVLSANGLVAPAIAFGLDLFDPVVNLLFLEVVKFFVPGWEDGICNAAICTWYTLQLFKNRAEAIEAFLAADHKFELRYIGSICLKVVKLAINEVGACTARVKDATARQKAWAQEDAMLSVSDGTDTRKYSEWVAHARAISEKMWQRFQESGEDTDGDMEDESWTLIG